METYLVRIWTGTDGQPLSENALRGIVRHVRSGEEAPFDAAAALVSFLRRPRGLPGEPAGSEPAGTRPAEPDPVARQRP